LAAFFEKGIGQLGALHCPPWQKQILHAEAAEPSPGLEPLPGSAEAATLEARSSAGPVVLIERRLLAQLAAAAGWS